LLEKIEPLVDLELKQWKKQWKACKDKWILFFLKHEDIIEWCPNLEMAANVKDIKLCKQVV
jgi:hypothetical protein